METQNINELHLKFSRLQSMKQSFIDSITEAQFFIELIDKEIIEMRKVFNPDDVKGIPSNGLLEDLQ